MQLFWNAIHDCLSRPHRSIGRVFPLLSLCSHCGLLNKMAQIAKVFAPIGGQWRETLGGDKQGKLGRAMVARLVVTFVKCAASERPQIDIFPLGAEIGKQLVNLLLSEWCV